MNTHTFEPDANAFVHTFSVARSDIDELGHANNVVWVRWVNEAAIAHADHVGFGPAGCRAVNCIWVVRRHDIEYLWPAFEGQTLEALTWPASLRGATSQRRTVFRHQGKVLARAETTWVLLDDKGKPTRAPSVMLDAYGFAK